MTEAVYLYGIAETGVPGLNGLDDAPIEAIHGAGLAALCSRHEAPFAPAATAPQLFRHDAVLEAVMEHGPVLPARFGSVLAGDAAVRILLEEREETFRPALARVRGPVELGVRVSGPDGEPAQPAPAANGTEYVQAKLAAQRIRRALASELDIPLAPLSVEGVVRPSGRVASEVAAAYLVERARVEEFRRAVEVFADARPDLDI